jgi:serine protease Do
MKRWVTWIVFSGLASTPVAGAADPQADYRAGFCPGAYSDDFASLSPQARDFDGHPDATFSYCTRNAAVYECLSYGPDGALKRSRRKVALHGTAFAFKRQGADALLLTNDHVASWPLVTDVEHPVDDVPPGCKKISESLTLVDDEHDNYGRDDIPVMRIATDPELDVAILKAHADLHIMPWKIGHSGALRERNVVEVRGFPLGAFRATNLGKVISVNDHDDYGEWDHDDFVVDALLSGGNSGSPVLAVSCATGEYELVGIFHAGYSAGSALNVVIGIDQVRDMMNTLKRSSRSRARDPIAIDGGARSTVQAALTSGSDIFFPVGSQIALVRGAPCGRLLFAVLPKDFPTATEPVLVLEDLPSPEGRAFGDVGRVWFGSPRGLKGYQHASLDTDAAAQTARLLEALRADVAGHLAYRAARDQSASSRQSDDRTHRLGTDLARTGASRADLLQAIAEMGERLGPQATEPHVRFASLLGPSLSSSGAALACDAAGSPPTFPLSASRAEPANTTPPAPRSVAVGSVAAEAPAPGTPAQR